MTNKQLSMSISNVYNDIETKLQDAITLLRPIGVICGFDNIMKNIPHIQAGCEEYSV
jgi:hypothetical protein